jgi:hypothetical protein
MKNGVDTIRNTLYFNNLGVIFYGPTISQKREIAHGNQKDRFL